MMKEFKDFAVKGNVVDMAVGLVIGAAFGKIVTTFVAKVFTPPLGLLLGGVNFNELKIVLKEAAEGQAEIVLGYGEFLQATIDFLIVAFAIFLVVKAMNSFKKKEAAAPAPTPAPTVSEELLKEIRDLLRK
jgi:large conductance mechanosensitive channel